MASYNAVDGVLHVKTGEDTTKIVLPVTRYANVTNAPDVETDISLVEASGAPFILFETETLTEDSSVLNTLIGSDIY